MIQLFTAKFSSKIDVENVGTSRLKAFIEENNEKIEVTYFNVTEDYKNQMHEVILDCNIFGFSMYDDTVEYFIQVINGIKSLKPSAIIVVGSKFVTLYYKEILEMFDNVDLAVLGDGEESLLGLIKHVNAGKDINLLATKHKNIASRNNLGQKRPAVLNINELPWPDRSWMKDSDKNIFSLICHSQSCIGKCSFCTQDNYYTQWNGRSPEDVYKEITEINDKFGIRWFYFTASSLEDPGVVGKENIRKLCLYLKENNKKFDFKYYLRADTFSDTEYDRELLKLMRSCGFNLATVGIESGNDYDLKILNKRASTHQNRVTLKLLDDADIFAKTFGFIMFNPYTTRENLTLNYRFLNEFNTCSMARFISKLRIYNQTEIFNRTKKDGLLTFKGKFYQPEGYLYEFKQPDIEEIDQFVRKHFGTDEIEKLNAGLETGAHFISSCYEFIEGGHIYIKKKCWKYWKEMQIYCCRTFFIYMKNST